MTDFTPGDKVRSTLYGLEYTIAFGPYNSNLGTSYLCRNADGVGHVIRAEVLEAIPPEDPRIAVVAQALSDWDGDLFVSVARYGAEVILAELDAMESAPASPARYKDTDGDLWEMQEDGALKWVLHSDGAPVAEPGGPLSPTMLEAIYGPTTRIN